MRREIYEICCQQPIFDAIVLSLQCQLVAGAVQMAVKTAAHIVALEQLQDLRTLIAPAAGRIMKENQFVLFPRRP